MITEVTKNEMNKALRGEPVNISEETSERINKFLAMSPEEQISFMDSPESLRRNIEFIREMCYENPDLAVKNHLTSITDPEQIEKYKNALGEEEFNRIINWGE
jgi:hypothetical protein